MLRGICPFPLNCQLNWHISCSQYFLIILSTSVESVVISSLILDTGNLCLFVLVSPYRGLFILLTFSSNQDFVSLISHIVFSSIGFYSNHHFLSSPYFWHNFLSFLKFLNVGATWFEIFPSTDIRCCKFPSKDCFSSITLILTCFVSVFFQFKILSIFSFHFRLTHELFSIMFSFQILKESPDIFVLLIVSLIPLWLEDTLSLTYIRQLYIETCFMAQDMDYFYKVADIWVQML